MRHHDLQRKCRGHRSVERVAAEFKHAHAGLRRDPMSGGYDAEASDDIGARSKRLASTKRFLQMSRGSSTSRRPSPSRLQPNTARQMNAPGQIDIQGASATKLRAAFSEAPQLGAGGC